MPLFIKKICVSDAKQTWCFWIEKYILYWFLSKDPWSPKQHLKTSPHWRLLPLTLCIKCSQYLFSLCAFLSKYISFCPIALISCVCRCSTRGSVGSLNWTLLSHDPEPKLVLTCCYVAEVRYKETIAWVNIYMHFFLETFLKWSCHKKFSWSMKDGYPCTYKSIMYIIDINQWKHIVTFRTQKND